MTLEGHPVHVRNCGRSFLACISGGGDVRSPKFALVTSDTQEEGKAGKYILSDTPTVSSIPSIRYSPSNNSNVHATNSSSGSVCGSKFQESRDRMSRDLVSVERSVGVLSAVSPDREAVRS